MILIGIRIMAKLSELNGLSVPVAIHTSKDTSFKKKPVRSIELPFTLKNPPALLFSQIDYFGQGFKICVADTDSDEDAKAEFDFRVNELNQVIEYLSQESFIHMVVSECTQFLDNIDTNIRSEHGHLLGAHEAKQLFSSAIVKHLKSQGIEAKCNIGKGSLYINDQIVINSGITSGTSLMVGLMDYFGFKLPSYNVKQYKMQSYKVPSKSYEEGSWLNVVGDKPFVLGFSIIVLEALKSLIERTGVLFGKNVEEDSFLGTTLESAKKQSEEKQEAFDKLVESPEFDTDVLLKDERITSNETFKELEVLGLGEAALKEFASFEAPMILLKELANSMGATSVHVFNAYEREERDNREGWFDEFYGPHVPLPDPATRKGMMVLKDALSEPNSLATYLFDASKLKLNVACTADYDHQNDLPTNPTEFLDVCLGGRPPLVDAGDVVRFVFKR